MKRLAALLLMVSIPALSQATEIQWTRFRGEVKALDFKKSIVTIQNKDGDLFTFPVDKDVMCVRGKAEVPFTDLRIDDKVILMRVPSDKPVVKPEEQQ
jgi:hypothetical protein